VLRIATLHTKERDMAINYGSFSIIDNGCVGGSGGGGGGGSHNSPIVVSGGGGPSPMSPGVPTCGKGFYFELVEWTIQCQASDGDIHRIRVPWLTIAAASPPLKADWFLDYKLWAYVNDSAGDGHFPLFQMLPIDSSRFSGIKLGGNSDMFQVKVNNDVDRDYIDIDFNYCGGSGEVLERAFMSDQDGQLKDMDISLWTFRIFLYYWWDG